jgi:hypothetical protein
LEGILPPSVAAMGARLEGVHMPDRLTGVRLRDGRAVGLDLPALGEREIVPAWRSALGTGPLYVRCDDRSRGLPIAQAQRLARIGELWLDAPLPDHDLAFELLVAGVHRLVVWPGECDVASRLDELGDSLALGWDGSTAWDQLTALATQHAVPVLCAAQSTSPAPGLDLYRVDLAATGRFSVERTQSAPLDDDASPVAGARDAGAEE